MDVLIVASKGCSHCQNFSKELKKIGVEHRVVFAEDEPELCQKHTIRHSPNLIVEDQVIFREQVDEKTLKEYFKC